MELLNVFESEGKQFSFFVKLKKLSIYNIMKALPLGFIEFRVNKIKLKRFLNLYPMLKEEKKGEITKLINFSIDKNLSVITFSSSGKMIASGNIQGNVTIFNLGIVSEKIQFGSKLLYFNDHLYTITALEFSPNEIFLATGSSDKMCMCTISILVSH